MLIIYRLLIGAPAANSGQPGVNRGGAVYKCPPESPRDCEMIPFDREGKNSNNSQTFSQHINNLHLDHNFT